MSLVSSAPQATQCASLQVKASNAKAGGQALTPQEEQLLFNCKGLQTQQNQSVNNMFKFNQMG